ncbi:g5689 [Coccomyxa elongata]
MQRWHRTVSLRASSGDSNVTGSSLSEVAALDKLIDLLKGASGQQELTKLVAENLLAFDQKFWIRLATRSDAAQSSAEKEGLTNLANTVMKIVDTIVKRTNSELADSGRVLQEILAAGANDRGEWELPLPADKVAAMRAALDARAEHLNEALLSNAFAWMRKASEDGLDGMVALLQKVLQLYAGRTLTRAGTLSDGDPAEAAVERLIAAEEEDWDSLLRQQEAQQVGETAMLAALRKKMEVLVLSLPSGSYAQRVQAEYLKELEGRMQAAFQSANAS